MATTYDARERYLARRDRGHQVEIVSPEGIPLHFTIASFGDRVNAFMIDLLILFGTLLALGFASYLAFGLSGFNSWIGVFLQLAMFVGTNFYFVWFEIRGQGRTPGKRAIGICVIDAAGGPLTVDAIVARNLLRQIELVIPLAVLSHPTVVWAGAGAWTRLVAGAWAVAFALMPLWNRHRLRIGDLVAGTMVVVTPRAVLLEDVSARPATQAATYTFKPEQLDVYGIYELQVLEGVLRDRDSGVHNTEAMSVVCEKIKTKIGWDRGQWRVDDGRFLSEFYAALRAYLERKLLFGKRKADKFAR